MKNHYKFSRKFFHVVKVSVLGTKKNVYIHFMSISLKSHVNSQGARRKALPFPKKFSESYFYSRWPKCFCMFSSKFVVLKKILGFSTFVVAEIFQVTNWKILKFCAKQIFVVKIGFVQKTKIFQFLTQNISATTNVENPKIFFSSETCKNILVDPSWIKIPLKKKSQGVGLFPSWELSCDLREIDIKWKQKRSLRVLKYFWSKNKNTLDLYVQDDK